MLFWLLKNRIGPSRIRWFFQVWRPNASLSFSSSSPLSTKFSEPRKPYLFFSIFFSFLPLLFNPNFLDVPKWDMSLSHRPDIFSSMTSSRRGLKLANFGSRGWDPRFRKDMKHVKISEWGRYWEGGGRMG